MDQLDISGTIHISVSKRSLTRIMITNWKYEFLRESIFSSGLSAVTVVIQHFKNFLPKINL